MPNVSIGTLQHRVGSPQDQRSFDFHKAKRVTNCNLQYEEIAKKELIAARRAFEDTRILISVLINSSDPMLKLIEDINSRI